MDNYVTQLEENNRTLITENKLKYKPSGKNNANIYNDFTCVTTGCVSLGDEVTYQYDWVYSVK